MVRPALGDALYELVEDVLRWREKKLPKTVSDLELLQRLTAQLDASEQLYGSNGTWRAAQMAGTLKYGAARRIRGPVTVVNDGMVTLLESLQRRVGTFLAQHPVLTGGTVVGGTFAVTPSSMLQSAAAVATSSPTVIAYAGTALALACLSFGAEIYGGDDPHRSNDLRNAIHRLLSLEPLRQQHALVLQIQRSMAALLLREFDNETLQAIFQNPTERERFLNAVSAELQTRRTRRHALPPASTAALPPPPARPPPAKRRKT